jgi:hypothetical protein
MTDAKRVTIAVLIDALSWDALDASRLLADRRACCKRLRTILGFSSAAVPSILTGQLPRTHGRWSYLYYDPDRSPFGWTRPARLAGPLTRHPLVDNPLLKRMVSRWTARRRGYDGYFPVYDFPLQHLHLMDHCSKVWDFKPAAFACPSIVDILQRAETPAEFLTYPLPEEQIFADCQAGLEAGRARLYFLYLTAIDALGHAHGPVGAPILERLTWYDARLRQLLAAGERAGYDVDLYLFSDHGMVKTTHTSDLRRQIEAAGPRFGRDYVAVYDSTMARFWYLNPDCRPIIEERLHADGCGRILTADEKTRYGVDFAGDRFGETIYLLSSGIVFHPSHMSRRVLTAMHGFDPDDSINDGVFLATRAPAAAPDDITHLLPLLLASLGVSHG